MTITEKELNNIIGKAMLDQIRIKGFNVSKKQVEENES